MNRFIRYLLEIFGGILILAVLGFGLLVWRLEQGSIKAAKIIPDIEAALGDMAPGLHFRIDAAELKSNDQYRSLNVNLRGITIFNAGKQKIGRLKEINLGFSWRNISGFSWAPVSMEIVNPTVEITRFPNGYVGFNLQEVNEEKHPVSISTVSDFLKHFPPNLRHIMIRDAFLRYDNQQDGYSFLVYNGLFDFHRRNSGITGVMNINLRAHDFEQRLQGTIATDEEKKVTRITFGLKDFLLNQARLFSPHIPQELELNLPVDLLLTADINDALQLADVSVQATGKAGDMLYPPYLPERLPLKDVFLSLHYLPLARAIELETLALSTDEAHVSAKGSAVRKALPGDPEKSSTEFTLLGLAEHVQLDRLKNYWPHGLGEKAREWVTARIRDGVAHRAGIDLEMTLDADRKATIGKLAGKIEFENASVNYLPPMPIVRNVNGEANFDHDHFDIATKGGKLFDTIVPQADIRISDIAHHAAINLEIEMAGPIRDALTTIASEPLRYTQKMGLSPEQFSGTAKTKLHLDFPLMSHLTLQQVAMRTKAELENVTASRIVKNLTVNASKLGLKVDREGLLLEGDALLAGAPAVIKWQKFFNEESPDATVIAMKGKATPALLSALELPVTGYFSGSADAEASITQTREKSMRVEAKANLLNMAVSAPEAGLAKPAGVPGMLNLKMDSEENGVTTLSDVNASWPGFSVAQGMARWGKNGGLESATLKNIRAGRTRASVILTPQGANRSRLVINGDVVDLSQFIAAKKQKAAARDTKRISVNLRAGQLFIDPEIPLNAVKADLVLQGRDLVSADIAGKADAGASLVLQQAEKADKSRALYLRAENAGRILQALDITDTVQGGTLLANGQSLPATPQIINGNFGMDNFSIRDAPIMARLLNALSPTGLFNLFNQKGLGFERMQSDFSLTDPDTVKLSKGKMTGDSLGLSFRGSVNRDKDTLNPRGTIIPIEGINKFASKIPLIGTVLTGLRGEGIFGATYRIRGPSNDPNVTVNPLSALAPGIFRSVLFESGD